MNIGLCSGRHAMKTNCGNKMDYYLFQSPVEDPTNVDMHEKVCREFIKNHITGDLSWKRSSDSIYEGLPRVSVYITGDLSWSSDRPYVSVYITGLTPLLTSFLKVWVDNQERLEMTCGDLLLWHWDTEEGQYVPQEWAMIT